MKILAVIDMQEEFSAANNPILINNICNRMQEYIDYNDYIFLIKYVDGFKKSSNILHQITDWVKSYRKRYIAIKDIDDGASSIIQAILHYDVDISNVEIELCGVNTTCCVMRTYYSLKRLKSDWNITINSKLCNDEFDGMLDDEKINCFYKKHYLKQMCQT